MYKCTHTQTHILYIYIYVMCLCLCVSFAWLEYVNCCCIYIPGKGASKGKWHLTQEWRSNAAVVVTKAMATTSLCVYGMYSLSTDLPVWTTANFYSLDHVLPLISRIFEVRARQGNWLRSLDKKVTNEQRLSAVSTKMAITSSMRATPTAWADVDLRWQMKLEYTYMRAYASHGELRVRVDGVSRSGAVVDIVAAISVAVGFPPVNILKRHFRKRNNGCARSPLPAGSSRSRKWCRCLQLWAWSPLLQP